MSSSLHHLVALLVAQSSTCIRVVQAACISVLPTIISEGEEAKPHTTAFMISILALSFDFFPGSAARVSGHLACGCFCLMSNPPKGWDLWELPYELCSCWGKLVRCSPHSNPELLHTLCEFAPPWNWDEKHWRMYLLHPIHFHDAHPDTPTELITQWQSYLEQSLSLYPDKDEDVSATKFEAEWQEKQKHIVDFNATSQSLPYKPLDGAEVVHCFEQIMETLYRDSEEEGSVEGSEEESESD
ncbi:hypothetical protein B0H16DRAFT_1769422 [Mycena metata]|uniref:Uncharacterized protein n=1 Tax=Mycena metata TaxID=1033252 RepID=A0AAD7NRT9_9AGAR|nr:hypothetical protein B0H16DRAFT_1769422 [Mycena metata]